MRSVEGGGEASKRMSRTLGAWGRCCSEVFECHKQKGASASLIIRLQTFCGDSSTTKRRLASLGRKPFDLNRRRCPGLGRVGQDIKRAGRM
jgi:hypothetical protein